MPSDPTKPLLQLTLNAEQERPIGRPAVIPPPDPFPRERQNGFTPQFDRLARVLENDVSGMELRADPIALAPERLLVFEVRGAVSDFARVIRAVHGLELVDEEEMKGDEDKSPVAYLMMPDGRALLELVSLWRRWQRNALVHGETPWRNVFERLRDLRPWGPQDRVYGADRHILADLIDGLEDDELISLEVELVYRAHEQASVEAETQVRNAIIAQGGVILSRARIDDIAYHAILADVPVKAIREAIDLNNEGLAGVDAVMHIRPQSLATSIQIADSGEPGIPAPTLPLGDPILALLDGVPVAAHPLLSRHLVIDDQNGLEPLTPVAHRVHGTAMASLIIHGDRNAASAPLPRRIHQVPVLGPNDAFPSRRLIIDVIYLAIVAMREGATPTAPGVLIVNISLGNPRRQFQGSLSPWARLLDRLAYKYGILFLVSAGNVVDPIGLPSFLTHMAFEDAPADERTSGTIAGLGDVLADRRLFSPSETVNGVTIGACNEDTVSAADRLAARVNVDPYPQMRASNPSSALGPGFALSVKPDILLPGGREHLRLSHVDGHLFVRPAGPSRASGLKVAAPPAGALGAAEGYTGGTSAATAIASRTCHRIHDALEAAYEGFAALPHVQRAVLLKALLVHPARWPTEIAALIKTTIGPVGGHHSHVKDNIRRFLGFGYVDTEDAVACADDRATFWASGMLNRNRVATISVPVPAIMGGLARPHSLSATLAWFSPVNPGRKSYRSVRLQILKPDGLAALSVSPAQKQPDGNQTNRGTVYSRRWEGDRAAAVGPNDSIELTVQRDPDPSTPIDEPVPFGLAITIDMPGVIGIYEQVRQRLAIQPRQPV